MAVTEPRGDEGARRDPPNAALVPMDPARLRDWMRVTLAEYVADRMKAGDSVEQAEANAATSFAAYFPGGLPAADHYVYDVSADGKPVGFLWIGPQEAGKLDAWWVWDIAIDPEHRGSGLGRATMLLAEQRVRELGGSVLGLNVFGFNTAARGLYESLGYETASIRMLKRL